VINFESLGCTALSGEIVRIDVELCLIGLTSNIRQPPRVKVIFATGYRR
jgi:hypothetical protein